MRARERGDIYRGEREGGEGGRKLTLCKEKEKERETHRERQGETGRERVEETGGSKRRSERAHLVEGEGGERRRNEGVREGAVGISPVSTVCWMLI